MTFKTDLPRPPVAPRNNITIEQLGRVRTDPYAWMKDDNWQTVLRDPSILREDIRKHLEAENAYTKTVLKDTEDLQATLFSEMVGRLSPVEESVPVPHGPWLYGIRYQEGAQHPLHIRRPRTGGEEEILLDADSLSKKHAYYSLAGAAHTENHRYYVYSEDVQGSEVYRIQVKDLKTGEICAPAIENTTGSFTLSPDGEWLFWIYRDEFGRPSRIYRRPLLGGKDNLVFEETDPGFFLSIGLSASKEWIAIERGDHDTNETLLIPAKAPTTSPQVAAPLIRGERYSLTHWNDRFIILTNQGGAADFKIMQTPQTATERENWVEFLPHQEGHFLLGVCAGRHHLSWIERFEGNENLYVLSAQDAPSLTEKASLPLRDKAQQISFDEPAYSLSLLGILEYDQPMLRYVYQSPTTPAHWYDINMETGERLLRKIKEVPSGHDPALYETQRLFAKADDGELVPITVLKRKETAINGSAPLLLYGYGSYGISMEAAFSTSILSLVDRGWVYAIAHIRGGSEKGWNWFLDGRKEKKTNSFTDFIASARHLITENYTKAGQIVAHGGSAGGLLMGAVANMAPELFAGIAAQVPFVDVLNTMSDTTLPLTPPEWPEWGNPLTDPKAYDLIASYSPYDNIHPKPYPAILALGGLCDPRVTYWEPAKWIARLRDIAQNGPFLCQINMEAGHGGSSGRFERLKETALVQAFALWCLEQHKAAH
ncbi:prolyl oligopeptidase family serine peptidase [Aristophania vespae]|uniref:Prolyl oligopeptidase family serine peptidase n=1 Tax=Aristophania vespae TaxID=2697033 RepID=A0A6P1NMN2_9PROT|nr:S9 family peptidase [Aristophania vespae]QHI96101.1 prolyl oligopeptidase family serine peptidase [Aristophania vespae]